MNFENWVNGEVSKIEHYFSKLSDLKINGIKTCAPKLIFFNKKKLGKIRMTLTLKIDFESQILAAHH